MGVAKVEYYGRTLIDLTGDSVNPDVLAEGETAHDANGDLIVGRGVLNKGNFANAIVGNVSGEMVAMDDVSPLEHKMPVKVRSKNLIPYPFSGTTSTINGVTFTDNGDGTITVNGQATADAVYYFSWHVTNPIALPKGVYILSGAPEGSVLNTYYLGIKIANSGVVTEQGAYPSLSLEMDSVLAAYIVVRKGITASNLVFKPQLELGTTATAYMPYIADDEVITVRSCGANVFDINSDYEEYYTGSFIKVENDKLISTSVQGGASGFVIFDREYPAGTYTICMDKETTDLAGEKANHCRILTSVQSDKMVYLEYYKAWYTDIDKNTPLTFTTTEPFKIGFVFVGAHASQMSYFNIMLNNGAPVTYEPYKEGEEITTTLAKGAELTSIAPNMTIYTDKEGAIVECSYNKDTNIVIEKLTQAIIALGGNV